MDNLKVYLAFSAISPPITNNKLKLKKVENPNYKLKNLFYKDGCENIIYEVSYNKNLLLDIIEQLQYFYNMDCSNNLDLSICQIFITEKNYVIKKREFINIYEMNKNNFILETNKYIAIGYFVPSNCQIINQKIKFYNQNVWILSIFYEKGFLNLHTCIEYKEDILFKYSNANTHRKLFTLSNNSSSDYIDSIAIDNKNIESRCGGGCSIHSLYQQLLYLYYKSINCINTKGLNHKNTMINTITFSDTKDTSLPINNIIIKPIKYKINRYLLQCPFTIEIGECKKDTKIYYNDPQDNKQKFFYIDKLELININDGYKEEVQKRIEEEKLDLTDEQIKQIIEINKQICPDDKRVLLITWESPIKDISFEFHTINYLDSELVSSSGSSIGFLLLHKKSYEQIGINGYIKNESFLSSELIEATFSGNLQMEAFYLNKTILNQKPVLLHLKPNRVYNSN